MDGSLPFAPRWPHRQELRGLPLRTPLPAVDLDWLRQVAAQVAADHAAISLAWRPKVPWAGASSLVHTLWEAGASGLTCGSLDAAEAAIAAGAAALTLLIPPVLGEGPSRCARLCQSARVVVGCDHYLQAERLASACREIGVEAEILLRVDVGRQRFGVRPGPNLEELARGVAGLAGVRLAGILVDSDRPEGVGGLSVSELGLLLERCRQKLLLAGREWPTISLSRRMNFGEHSIATEARTPLSFATCGSFAILASVVSRPTRDRAVLDVGRLHLGESARVAGPEAGQAEICEMNEDYVVLRLGSNSQSLLIGDLVPLVPEVARCLPRGQSMLVMQEGRARLEQVH